MKWAQGNMRCLVDLWWKATYSNSLLQRVEEVALACPVDMPLVTVRGKGSCSAGEAAGCSPGPKVLGGFKQTWAKSLSATSVHFSAFSTHSVAVIKATGKQHIRAHLEDRECWPLVLSRAKVCNEAQWDVVHLASQHVHQTLALQGSTEGCLGLCPSGSLWERVMLRDVCLQCPLAAVNWARFGGWELWEGHRETGKGKTRASQCFASSGCTCIGTATLQVPSRHWEPGVFAWNIYPLPNI